MCFTAKNAQIFCSCNRSFQSLVLLKGQNARFVPVKDLIQKASDGICDMISEDNIEKLTDRQKKELRIWAENRHVNYYNFKTKKELPK